MIDVAIIGGGPAGLSAAVNVRARGADCLIISNDITSNPLAKSPKVDNFIGMSGMTGEAMLRKMKEDAQSLGIEFRVGHVLSVAAYGDSFMLSVGSDIVQAKRVILAVGVRAIKKLEGEDAFLGRGVSYCATCDGMLYRGKKALVIGNADDLAHEAALLADIGVEVTVVGQRRPDDLPDDMAFVSAKPTAVAAGKPITLQTDQGALSADVVFILRNEQAITDLVPGLQTNGKFIAVNDRMETNISGVYAAGDCVGKPLQVAKAAADGLLAAWAATDSLK